MSSSSCYPGTGRPSGSRLQTTLALERLLPWPVEAAQLWAPSMHERTDHRTTPAVSPAPGLDRRHAPHRVRRLLTVALPALLCASLLLVVGHDAAGPFVRSGSISYALIAENIAET